MVVDVGDVVGVLDERVVVVTGTAVVVAASANELTASEHNVRVAARATSAALRMIRGCGPMRETVEGQHFERWS